MDVGNAIFDVVYVQQVKRDLLRMWTVKIGRQKSLICGPYQLY